VSIVNGEWLVFCDQVNNHNNTGSILFIIAVIVFGNGIHDNAQYTSIQLVGISSCDIKRLSDFSVFVVVLLAMPLGQQLL